MSNVHYAWIENREKNKNKEVSTYFHREMPGKSNFPITVLGFTFIIHTLNYYQLRWT